MVNKVKAVLLIKVLKEFDDSIIMKTCLRKWFKLRDYSKLYLKRGLMNWLRFASINYQIALWRWLFSKGGLFVPKHIILFRRVERLW